MIREVRSDEYQYLSELWLRTSIKAHSFVPQNFWVSNLSVMRDEYLPASETWLIEDESNIVGFMCLVDDQLAALFIAPEKQGRGLGALLIEKAKKLRSRLELSVYTQNTGAVVFYEKHGFAILVEQQDVHTGFAELVMCWDR
ncbi:GNAT family N-acetyltransferase [Maridesulfovibrio zosterae]|uniref:GNAT family N-acetyltransferase n=1 Tax=Maridesulfovibrio zosterae TaxID=82171 RepID=UPI00041FD226|nr:GNAT family N-acetyltransferase [Maridesulfovibrio zosterae]